MDFFLKIDTSEGFENVCVLVVPSVIVKHLLFYRCILKSDFYSVVAHTSTSKDSIFSMACLKAVRSICNYSGEDEKSSLLQSNQTRGYY